MGKDELLTKIIIGLNYLKDKHHYKQIEIVHKMRQAGYKISPSSISNFYNRPEGVGIDNRKIAEAGLDEIMKRDLCLSYDPDIERFREIEHCVLDPIRNSEPPVQTASKNYTIHTGRLPVSEKVALYKTAKTEIIEIGIRLKSFNTYFSGKRDELFMLPILERLEAGVNFKCFVADPEGSAFKNYVRRMGAFNLGESEIKEDIALTHERLKNKFIELNKYNYLGRMEFYKYTSAPIFHATVIDPELESGKILISHYLYGVRRANCPAIELSKIGNRTLFKTYWKSIKSITTPSVKSKEKSINLLK